MRASITVILGEKAINNRESVKSTVVMAAVGRAPFLSRKIPA